MDYRGDKGWSKMLIPAAVLRSTLRGGGCCCEHQHAFKLKYYLNSQHVFVEASTSGQMPDLCQTSFTAILSDRKS